MKIFKFIILALFLSCIILLLPRIKQFLPVNAPVVTLSARPSRIHIGDTVKLQLTVKSPPGSSVIMPDFKKELNSIPVRKKELIETRFPWVDIRSLEIWITSYDPGVHTIDPFEIKYIPKTSAEPMIINSNNIRIYVERLIQKDLLAEQQIGIGGGMDAGAAKDTIDDEPRRSNQRVITAPIRFPIIDTQPLRRIVTGKDIFRYVGLSVITLIAAGLILIFIFSFVIKIFHRPKPSLEAIALKKLRQLQSEHLLDSGREKLFCIKLSNILIQYLNVKFSSEKISRTSKDAIDMIRNEKNIPDDHKDFISRLLDTCSVIKYSERSDLISSLDPDLVKEKSFFEMMKRIEEGEGDSARAV